MLKYGPYLRPINQEMMNRIHLFPEPPAGQGQPKKEVELLPQEAKDFILKDFLEVK